MDIKGKKISIIGAVRSGVGAARLAKKLGAIPFVSDSGSKEKLEKSLLIFDKEGIAYEFDSHTERVFDCDFIIVSPGVPSDSVVLTDACNYNKKIFSEIEFASWFCKGKIIAVTGTNGKTTTATLISHVLNESGLKCHLAGNIGQAFAEIVLDVNENEFVSLEISSFQLDHIENFKPDISIMLNITPDHLDRYENSFDKYIASKINITKNQDEKNYFIFNADDQKTIESMKNNRVQQIGFSTKKEVPFGAFSNNGKMFFAQHGKVEDVCSVSDLFIKGEHNLSNALSVLAAAKLLNISNAKIRSAFSSFKGVEHRIEFVRELNGVEYYNDSKATNVDSVWHALRSFDKPIFLILGGKDKGNDYGQIRSLVEMSVKKIYAVGSSANKVYDYFKDIVTTEYKQTIESCVDAARKEAKPGTVVLLSPACASFDMFDNYEHRGMVFKEAVKKLA